MSDRPETHVVTCFLRAGGDVLLLRRSSEVGSYPGLWGAVAGHAEGDPEAAALEEIREETGIEDVELVRLGDSFPVVDESLGKRWIVHPFLFDTKRVEPELNWESTSHEWAPPTEILRRDVVPKLWDSYAAVAPSLESIRSDYEHGSAYISIRALEVLRDQAALGRSWEELKSLAQALIESRGSMAALRNRINRVMYLASRAVDDAVATDASPHGSAQRAVEAIAHRSIQEALSNDQAAASTASDLIGGKTVLTLSRSGTVTDAILEARCVVLVAASEPGGEGRQVATTLAREGIDVTLVPDAGLSSLPPFDLVLVGADTILPDGDILNKLGTYTAGLVAADRGVPLYVVASIDKILVAGEPSSEESGWMDALQINVWAPLFERTPARLVSGYITEKGLLDLSALRDRVAQLRELERWG